MIILDIETTGVNSRTHGMVSLGAVDYNTGEEFYRECHIEDFQEITPIALQINGFTEEQCRDKNKPSQGDVYLEFTQWAAPRGKLLAGHNIGHFDILFLEEIHARLLSQGVNAGKFPFSYRTVDLHSIAYTHFGESLTHEQICVKLGLPPEPKPHHALYGARSEKDALKKILSLK